MKIKKGVIMAGIQLPMRKVLIVAEKVFSEYGVELVITSCLDGVHSAGSFHPFGLAVDLRTRTFDSTAAIKLAMERIRRELGKDYDIVFEGDHMHIEYDPK